jgi:hypothetical protein
MKKFITLTLAIALIGTSAFADNNKQTRINGIYHFNEAYNYVSNAIWSTDGKFDKAIFMDNGIKNEVFYTKEGDLVGKSTPYAFDKLPKSALQTITTKYTFPAYELSDCIAFENADGDTTYFISMNTEKEKLVLEISQFGSVSVFSKEKK